MKLKIWHISDTHGYHNLLDIPKNIDIVIHSGDATNQINPAFNNNEMLDFIDWYSNLDIPVKIFVAGNHDTSIEKRLITKSDFKKAGIIYLENETIKLYGLKIFGSPNTLQYGKWSFMRSETSLSRLWENIDIDTDIIITHSPPYSILDLAYRDNKKSVEMTGSKSLIKKVLKINPKFHLFGHLHNNDRLFNFGYRTISHIDTIFSNGTVVTDGKFGELSSNGNVFEIEVDDKYNTNYIKI